MRFGLDAVRVGGVGAYRYSGKSGDGFRWIRLLLRYAQASLLRLTRNRRLQPEPHPTRTAFRSPALFRRTKRTDEIHVDGTISRFAKKEAAVCGSGLANVTAAPASFVPTTR